MINQHPLINLNADGNPIGINIRAIKAWILEAVPFLLTQNYPECKTLITDNEAVLVCNATKKNYQKYGIVHVTTPVQHSTSNGQVERTHSTLIELIRCLKKTKGHKFVSGNF